MAPLARGHDASAFLSGTGSLARKLSLFVPLSAADRHVLDALVTDEEQFGAGADIVAGGTMPTSVFLVQQGIAVRRRDLPDGGRQIMTFLIPGDLCDPHMFLLKAVDHSISAATPVRIASLSRRGLTKAFATRPRISAALLWNSMQGEAILRERIVSMSHHDARGCVAHLLCDLFWRHAAMGLAKEETFRLPLSLVDLGEALGLTAVHVHHVLTRFHQHRLIALERRSIQVLNVDRLQDIARYSKGYLHLGGPSPEIASHFDQLEDRRSRDEVGPAAGRYH